MIKALIFDCIGVLYTDPTLTHTPSTPARKKEPAQPLFHGYQRNQPLITLIEELRASYKVAMLSNTSGNTMDGFFSPPERQQLFDAVVLSGDVKLAKPDKAIFELTCKQLAVDLTEAIMIDDSQTTCDTVKTFGMPSIHYKDFEQCRTDLAVLIAIN